MLSSNAVLLLNNRYAHKDKGESADGVMKRVAKAISIKDDKFENKLLELMSDGVFLPNSPTIRNAGRKKGLLSACLVGDTIVHTCLGDFTLKDLADKYKDKPNEEFDVYCATSFSSLGIGKAFNPRLTQKNAPVYKVTFDDDSYIKATEDHLVMLRNGNFKRVDGLKDGDSVMPFNYDYNHRYLIIFAGIDKYPIAAHKFVYETISGTKLKSNEVIHHKDFKIENNEFINLEKRDKKEHFLWHSQNSLGDNNPMRDRKSVV